MAKLENFNQDQLADIIAQLPNNLPYIIEVVEEGYSSTCFFIRSDEKQWCLRLYNWQDSPLVKQEVEALKFCHAKGLPVPELIKWNNHNFILKTHNMLAICYICINGRTVRQNELCPDIASQAGKLLAKFIKCAVEYKGEAAARDEVAYLKQLYSQRHEALAQFLDPALIKKIEGLLSQSSFNHSLQQLDQGLVHGDFYYGNVIIKDHHLCGIIDFGDAYFGVPFFDIVTGAMEFSCNKDQQIDFDCLQSFLMPLRSLLLKQHITTLIFYHAMLLMCLKFLLLTLGQHNENDYAKRLENLISKAMTDKIKHFF